MAARVVTSPLEPVQLVPLALSVNTVVVMWLAGSARVLAWWLALAGQAGWLLFVVLFDAWGLLPLCVALSFVYSRNLIRWRRERARDARHDATEAYIRSRGVQHPPHCGCGGAVRE